VRRAISNGAHTRQAEIAVPADPGPDPAMRLPGHAIAAFALHNFGAMTK
jgi:hypothetical protein